MTYGLNNIGQPVNDKGFPVTSRTGDVCIIERYDDKTGLLTEWIKDNNADGLPDEALSYKYDDSGRVIKETNEIREIIDREKNSYVIHKKSTGYEYDKKGNVILQTTDTDDDGTIDSSIQTQYDRRNRKAKESYFGQEGQLQKEIEYDKKGRIIKETQYIEGEEPKITTYEYKSAFQEFLSSIFS